jgi:hypothetical protein
VEATTIDLSLPERAKSPIGLSAATLDDLARSGLDAAGNARVMVIFQKRYPSAPTGRRGVALVTLISLNNDHRYKERIEERLPIHALSYIESFTPSNSDFSGASVTRPLSVGFRECRPHKTSVTHPVTGCRTMRMSS